MTGGAPPPISWTSAPPPPGALPGDPLGALPHGTVVGKYEIVGTLGQGGFGITYRARDARLGRDVAIKEYLPTAFAHREGNTTVLPRSTRTADDFLWGRERFLDEAKTLARLENVPGIVNVYDFLEANGTVYMVMTLVQGETLEARLKREGRLMQPAVLQFLYPLLDGLEVVHAVGFLHRDIKPANILLDATGRPTLIDFGASRMALQGRTQAMTAVFTPGYAAPEQITSARQGAWTDIYALAGTLYHCVSGRMPPNAIERLSGDGLVPAAHAGAALYAPSLLAAIDAGLRLNADDRPQSIVHWRRILSGLVAGTEGVPSAASMARPAVAVPASGGGRRGKTLAWASAGVVLLALAIGGGWMLAHDQARRAEEARQAALVAQRQEEAARLAAEHERQRQEAARLAADQERQRLEAARRQQEEERQRAEAARRAEEERLRQEAETRRRAEEQAEAAAAVRRKAEDEARARTEAEATRRREEEARAAAERARRDGERRDAVARGWIIDERTGCRVRNPHPQPNETVTWSGPCVNGAAHGQGTLQWYQNSRPSQRFAGELRNGTVHGRGTLIEANGLRHAGDFVNGVPNGRGVRVWADGNRYEGEWHNGRANGPGVLFTRQGQVVAGRSVNGCFRGGTQWAVIDGTKAECGFR